jgi:hypothetical protein
MWSAFIPALLLAAPQAPAADTPRRELARAEQILYERVEQVSRTSAMHLLGMGETCRAYHVKGIGAFFVLAPRALPIPPGTQIVLWGTGPMLPDPPPRPIDSDARKANQKEAARREAEVKAIEDQVREFQREAQRAREEAERLMDHQIEEMQKFQGRAGSVPAVAPVAPVPPLTPLVPPEPPGARMPPQPPWEGWFIGEDRRDPRPAHVIVRDVETAVTGALESVVDGLSVVAPDELVIVAVDFYPQGAFGIPIPPMRTLVVRAKKKDLVDGASGKITPEELQKRIEYIQY